MALAGTVALKDTGDPKQTGPELETVALGEDPIVRLTVVVVTQPKLLTVNVYTPLFTVCQLLTLAFKPTPVQPAGPDHDNVPGPPAPVRDPAAPAQGGADALRIDAVGAALTTTTDCVDETQPAELIV